MFNFEGTKIYLATEAQCNFPHPQQIFAAPSKEVYFKFFDLTPTTTHFTWSTDGQ
jgi:hypothetical protein